MTDTRTSRNLTGLQDIMDRRAVFVCTDRRMLIPALFVAAAAVRERDRGSVDYDVLLFAAMSDVDESHCRWMADKGIRHIPDLDIEQLDRFTISNPRLSRAALYRLLVPPYLSGQYDRLIYMDVDVSIRGPLAPLFSLDLGKYGIAAAVSGEIPEVLIHLGGLEKFQDSMRELGMSEPFVFLNSGVLLIDVDWWNRNELGSRALDYLFDNFEKCPVLDENALNALLDGHFVRLSPVWNLRSWTFSVPGAQKLVEPVVVHYDGMTKPWKKFGDLRPLFHQRNEYQEYCIFLRNTDWQEWLREQWTVRDIAQNFRFEVAMRLNRILGRRTWMIYSAAEQRAIERAFDRSFREKPYADIEQGLVVYNNGRLRLA